MVCNWCASKGLGLTLVKKLLSEGYQVAATSRNSAELGKAVDVDTTNFLPVQASPVATGIQVGFQLIGLPAVIRFPPHLK